MEHVILGALAVFMLAHLVLTARLRRVTAERDAIWESHKKLVLFE